MSILVLLLTAPSGSEDLLTPSGRSFIFSLSNPQSLQTMFMSLPSTSNATVRTNRLRGPTFGKDALSIGDKGDLSSVSAPLNGLDFNKEDILGQNPSTFLTGQEQFTLDDLEVLVLSGRSDKSLGSHSQVEYSS